MNPNMFKKPDPAAEPEPKPEVIDESEPLLGAETITADAPVQGLADPEPLPPEADLVQYSSHPTQRLRIGVFQFEQGLLKVSPEDAKALDDLLSKCSPMIRNMVQKIDVDKAEAFAKRYAESKKVAGIDTTANTTI